MRRVGKTHRFWVKGIDFKQNNENHEENKKGSCHKTQRFWQLIRLFEMCYMSDILCIYFMLSGNLSENNRALSLDNFTVSSSEIIIHRANRLLLVISRSPVFRYPSIRLANYLMENV